MNDHVAILRQLVTLYPAPEFTAERSALDAAIHALSADPTQIDVDALAQEIRRLDGSHSLGAGAFAEALAPYIAGLSADRGEAVAVDFVLAALGHVRKPNERCLAVEDHSKAKDLPGPPSPPIFCYLPAGHAGLHRCNLGGTCHPYPMREPIVMRDALPEVCAKCRVAWPCADAKAVYAATPPSPAESAEGDALGRFGHHPDPANDFCVEVESLQGRLFNARYGIAKMGEQPESVEQVREAIARAMQFKVGGDEIAVSAKQILRALEQEAKATAPSQVSDAEIERALALFDAECWRGRLNSNGALTRAGAMRAALEAASAQVSDAIAALDVMQDAAAKADSSNCTKRESQAEWARYDAAEKIVRAALSQPQPGRVEGMVPPEAVAIGLLWRVVHDDIAGSCIENETLAAIQTFLDPVQFPAAAPTAGGES